jgi:hypothetical protein
MPILSEVGQALARRLLGTPRFTAMLSESARRILERGGLPTGNVEMWLSSLAERQPFMSQTEGTLNQAVFQIISMELYNLIVESQIGYVEAGPPWLHRLIRLWHRRGVTVVNFNYDTLVESSVSALDPPHANGDIVAEMLTHLPRSWVPTLGGDGPVPTFRLLKLHGSVNWFWSPDDRTGDTLCRVGYSPVAAGDARAALAGKEPFIVPPLAAKSPFYSLGVIRQLWSDAADALAAADRVIVLGYSVPLTDLATTTMLSQCVNPEAEWDVVNPDSARVSDRLVQLGIPADLIRTHQAVDEWVDGYEVDHCARMSSDLVDQILDFDGAHPETRPVMTRRSRSDYGIVHSMVGGGSDLVLNAHLIDPRQVIPAEYPHQSDLVDSLRRMESPGPVSVRLDGDEGEYRVLGALDPLTVRGADAVLDWCPIEIQDVSSLGVGHVVSEQAAP